MIPAILLVCRTTILDTVWPDHTQTHNSVHVSTLRLEDKKPNVEMKLVEISVECKGVNSTSSGEIRLAL